jgi:hypothetical protein
MHRRSVRELAFALEYRGKAWSVPGSGEKRAAKTVAPSQLLRTMLGPDGIESRVEHADGEHAVLESQIDRFEGGAFVEEGTISFGSAGKITFKTLGRGAVGPSLMKGWQHGAVVWKVTGGDGKFAECEGIVTSNFIVSADGDVIDSHFTRLYLVTDGADDTSKSNHDPSTKAKRP